MIAVVVVVAMLVVVVIVTVVVVVVAMPFAGVPGVPITVAVPVPGMPMLPLALGLPAPLGPDVVSVAPFMGTGDPDEARAGRRFLVAHGRRRRGRLRLDD